MHRDPAALTKTKFDLVVPGGGIQGAATAREGGAAFRSAIEYSYPSFSLPLVTSNCWTKSG